MKIKDYLAVVCGGVVLTGVLLVLGVGSGESVSKNDLVLMGVVCIALGSMGLAIFGREDKR